MNFRKLIFAALIICAAASCKKDKDSTITPGLDGILSIKGLPQFVGIYEEVTLKQKGVSHPDGGELTYTWKVSPEKGKPFVTERSVDFPYQFYKASLAIAPGYREAYMNLTAQKYQREFPFGNYITGQRQSYVRIYDASKVRLVEKGVWDVTIVATRIHASGDSILAQEIFNRVIRVRAIAPASNERLLWGERDTHLGRLLNQMQYQGLQIVQIDEF